MKLCLDGTIIRSPMSGVQLSVRHEILSLIEPLSGAEVCVFCRDEPVFRASRECGWTALAPPVWAGRPAGRILWQQVLLPGILRRRGAEALHAFAYTAPLRCPIPYVLNVHDIIALEYPQLCSRLNALQMRLLLPRSIARAAACIVSTEHVARGLVSRLGVPREKVTVAPLGVDAARFGTPAQLPAELCEATGSRPFLLFVGNLEPKKGLDTLLDAYAEVAKHQDLPLVLAGRAAWGSGRLLARIRGWQGPGRICLLGRVPATTLPALYQSALIAVMPSLAEGFGMPVLEAMAAGAPVVHSDHPALMEAAGGAGLSFRRGDAAELAACLERLISEDRARDDLARAGATHAAACTWERWGRKAGEALRQVASGQAR